MREGGQLGEAGEHPPKPTNWRGTTTKRSLTELRLTRWDQLRTVHGREISGNDANGKATRQLAKKRRKERGSKGGPQLASHKTPECDEARERSGTTGRLPAPRSQKQPDDQTGEVKTHEREPWQPRVRTHRGRSQQYTIQRENWKTQPTWEPQ